VSGLDSLKRVGCTAGNHRINQGRNITATTANHNVPGDATHVSDADNLQACLRCALEGTNLRAPRPLSNLELPARARHLLSEEKIARLRPAAVLVPIIKRSQGWQVLLTQRTDTLRRHAGQISFPGGSQETQDQDLVATALRESHEEIGLAPTQVEVIGFLDDYPTITGFRITPVVGVLDEAASVLADGVEVAEIFEVPLATVANKQSYKRDTLVRDGFEVPYYAINHIGYRIWGATAGMLRDLCLKINASCNVSYTENSTGDPNFRS